MNEIVSIPVPPNAVRILWGEFPDAGETPIEYKFSTEAELNAFLKGVDEACGWMGYDTSTPELDGTWTQFERSEVPVTYRNFYVHCATKWYDTWNCMCNDKCPVCGAEIEAYQSEEVNELGKVLRLVSHVPSGWMPEGGWPEESQGGV